MAPSKPKHHERFWIRGGDLYFRVEQHLFRVHSYFFVRESKHWKDRLVGPISPGDEPLKEGQDEKNVIHLENEKSEDFAQFLWVFYNDAFGDYKKATLDNWKAILHFASIWDFHEVQALAIRHLENLEFGLVERVKLYQDNKVPEKHLFRRYIQLAEREELLELEDARALGLETYVLVQQARERLRAQVPKTPPYTSPIRKDLKQKDIVEIVAATFKLSLADISSASGSQPNGSTPH